MSRSRKRSSPAGERERSAGTHDSGFSTLRLPQAAATRLLRLLAAAVVSVSIVSAPAFAATSLPRSCDLVFVEDTGAAFFGLRRLVFDVAFAAGTLAFGSDPVACTVDVSQPGVAGTFAADDAAGKLRVDLYRANGIYPGPLVSCTPRGADDALLHVPTVTLVVGEDLAGKPLNPAPVVSLDTYECTVAGTTTTLPLPTTTVVVTTTSLASSTTTVPGPTTTSLAVLTTTTTEDAVTTTVLPPALCGDGDGNGTVTASDALLALRQAVDTAVCPSERCDTDASGSVTASDALRMLRVAVEIPETLHCP